MKKIRSTLLGFLCRYAVQDQSRVERIQSSYMPALGRQPSRAEINYWNSRKQFLF